MNFEYNISIFLQYLLEGDSRITLTLLYWDNFNSLERIELRKEHRENVRNIIRTQRRGVRRGLIG